MLKSAGQVYELNQPTAFRTRFGSAAQPSGAACVILLRCAHAGRWPGQNDNAYVFEDNTVCQYEAPLTKAKFAEVAIALESM